MEWWSFFGCITCIEVQIHVPLFLNSVLDKLFCISKWESYNYEHLQFILGWPSLEKYSITGEALLCCFLEGWFVFTVSNMFDCGEATVHEPRAPLCVAWRRLALLAELNLKWLQWYEIDHVCKCLFVILWDLGVRMVIVYLLVRFCMTPISFSLWAQIWIGSFLGRMMNHLSFIIAFCIWHYVKVLIYVSKPVLIF